MVSSINFNLSLLAKLSIEVSEEKVCPYFVDLKPRSHIAILTLHKSFHILVFNYHQNIKVGFFGIIGFEKGATIL